MKIRDAVIIGAVFLLFFIFQPGVKTVAAATKATVTASSLNVRTGPGTQYKSIGLIKSGQTYGVLGSQNGWYKLQVGSKVGWSYGQYLKITTTTSTTGSTKEGSTSSTAKPIGTVKVTTSLLNVRSSASTSSSKIGSIKSGETYQYYTKSGSWYKIKYGSTFGWVHGDYVAVVNAGASAPVASLPSRGSSTGISAGETVVVERAITSMKSDADLSSTTIERLKRGDICIVLDSKSEWVKVQYGSLTGWVKGEYLKPVNSLDGGNSGENDSINYLSSDLLIDLDGLKEYKTEYKNVIAIPVTSKVSKSEGIDALKPKMTYNKDSNGNIVITVSDSRFNGSSFSLDNQLASSVSISSQDSSSSQLTVNTNGSVNCSVYSVPSKTTTDQDYSYLKSYIVISLEPSEGNSKQNEGDKNSEGKTKGNYLIVLDAGHGGTTPGAISGGYTEKELNMYIIDKLNDELKAQGYDTYLTRDGDVYVSLAERADSANILKADIFVSVHLNSASSPSSNGTETLYYENSPADGKKLAEIIQKHLIADLGRYDRGIKNRPDLYVLNSTYMPAALAELMFMSNSEDMSLISRTSTRRKAARSIADAINEYFGFDN